MSDVRDRETQSELKTADEAVKPRQSLVVRALSPLRRSKSSELAPVDGRPVDFGMDEGEPKPRTAFRAILISLILVVLLPMSAAGVYLFGFASDQYVAEARFAVRQAQGGEGSSFSDDKKEASGGGSASSIMSGSFHLAGEDAEIIANYIHSRAVIDDVSKVVNVRAIFSRPEADFLSRLPRNASAEDLDKYWNKMVSVYIEATSGIVQVSVAAFRRQDALDLTQAILTSAQDLANRMTLKVRADQMKTAEEEVHRSEGAVRFALADLTSFRNSQHIIDPTLTSQSTGKLLLQLMADKIETESQLFVAQRIQGPDAPGLASTKAKLDSIDQHITQLQDQMAGNKQVAQNLAGTLSRFEELELKKQFAERMYGFARDGMERARIAAERQAIYLAVFEPPMLPQDYTYPLRWTDFILISGALIMLWVSGATVTASVLDHRL